ARNPIVIVICPLKSLVDSHIRELEKYRLTATGLTDDPDEEGVKRGLYSFVFGSPESYIRNEKWRCMLQSDEYQKGVFTFVTDEAHVVPKWGYGSKNGKEETAAFRGCFSRIGELRSIGPKKAPMLALTATAKLETQAAIVKSLCLQKGYEKIFVSPYRENIYLSKCIVTTNLGETFSWLIKKLIAEQNALDRTIVYCKTIKDCGQLFHLFMSELGDDGYLFSH
ncbi:hypothetical protein QZH41_011499, partial [Actinostola sp. cb2023]